ncbi:hypothetical protein Tco_1329584 [Tanacetum coccineum]
MRLSLLANDLMDQKLRTYAERQNDNKRKADDSSRNNQQPHNKQNVARAYTAGPGEKKAYTGNLPLCTKCNYHHTGQCAPNVETGRGRLVSITFSALINITSTMLESHYDVELADGEFPRKLNTILCVVALYTYEHPLITSNVDDGPTGTSPVARAPYRLALFEMKNCRNISRTIRQGIYKAQLFTIGARILFGQEERDFISLCIVLFVRMITKLTVKNRYPLPRIDDLFDQLQGSSVLL